jgi:ABC-2 type transport system ATP-binding protein
MVMQSVVSARGLGLHTRRGWVFRDVDLDVAPGELRALTGPAGSGRTSLLLALAGRFKITDGALERHGRAALAYVPGVTDPDPNLTVAEHISERSLLLGRDASGPRRWSIRPGADRPPSRLAERLGRDLTPLEKHRLGLTLAQLENPDLIAVDDADTGLSTAERIELWKELQALADEGYAVIATCREDPR